MKRQPHPPPKPRTDRRESKTYRKMEVRFRLGTYDLLRELALHEHMRPFLLIERALRLYVYVLLTQGDAKTVARFTPYLPPMPASSSDPQLFDPFAPSPPPTRGARKRKSALVAATVAPPSASRFWEVLQSRADLQTVPTPPVLPKKSNAKKSKSKPPKSPRVGSSPP